MWSLNALNQSIWVKHVSFDILSLMATPFVPSTQVIWEYYDGGQWNALSDPDSFQIEHSYCEGVTTFQLEDAHVTLGYNLGHMTRTHLRTRAIHRIKRTPFSEDRPEG